MERFKPFVGVYVLLVRDGKIFLIRRARTGFADGNYILPAGHIDGDEPATLAVVREAREEAGVILRPEDLRIVHFSHRRSQQRESVDIFFEATSWKGEPCNAEPEKCDDADWFSLNDLPRNTIPYIRSAINHWNNKVFYSEFGWDVQKNQ